jgi:hypothetical protein
MTLIELAERRRSERDPLLKMGTAILRLNERIAEEQDAIREQAIISMDESGVPGVMGFRDGQIVERSQLQIAALTDSKSQLESLIDEAEAAFEDFGLPAMSMEALDEMIRENQDKSHEIALKINRIARKLLVENPALTLPELFANEELQELEGMRSAAIIQGAKEAGRLIELKDRLIPLCKEGSTIADDIFYPHRKAISDPARISEMRSA